MKTITHGGVMNTAIKGKIAEEKVIIRALEKEWICSRPVFDAKYDLVLDDYSKLYRVQVKYADGDSSHADGCVVASLRTRDYKQYKDLQLARYQDYDFDVLMLYVPKIDKVLWLDKDRFLGKATLNIRLEPPKNGRKKLMNMAVDLIW
jgi:hypothetical protein